MALHPHSGSLKRERSSRRRVPVEAKLKSEDRGLYRALVDYAPVGLMVLEPHVELTQRTFRIVAANQAILALSPLNELKPADLTGRPLDEVFPSISTKDLDRALAEAGPAGSALHLGQLQFGEGRVPEHSFSIQAFALPDGCLGLVFETISERKRAEEALRILESGFLDFIESAPDAMLLCDRDGKILLANAQTEQLFGYRRAQLCGQPLNLLVPEPFRERLLTEWQEYLAQPQTHRRRHRPEFFGRRVNGTEFPVEISLSAFQTEAGPRVCAAIRDLTESKRAEQALLQTAEELTRSNKELDQFAHAASHDLQEPLRSISSLSRLLVLDYSEKIDATGITYLSAVVESAKRMQGLLDGLLKYSRVGAQRNPVDLVNCEEACDAAVADLRVAFEQSHAVLTRDPLPTVPGDRTQLIQLFQNLLANAIKFRGPDLPRVHISAQRREHEWLLAVRDNGIGIDPQKFDQIFLLFHRLHSRDEYPGTGIGLALCRKIVSQHGGHMWVESTPGKGAIFFFTLPTSGHASK
ncbi:MAG TPA: ATP-binding protein [Candidatus Limnocylindrales bacterium]|nr:ATP-binding protein [Candidatus Limnocylindrales bacterium]